MPLLVEGRLIGVMHEHSATPCQFTDDDLHLLQLVADRVALARALAYDPALRLHRGWPDRGLRAARGLRVVLDQAGAEALLGTGDTLFLAADGTLTRVQGALVRPQDVRTVIAAWAPR